MSPRSNSFLPLRYRLAVITLLAVNWLSRRLGRGTGTVVGGRAGLWVEPRLLERLLRGRDVVLVSGTNGKTTTTALVRAALGGATASNVTGSNMPAGLVAALAAHAETTAVLEVDEPWLETVMASASSAAKRTVVLLNLSRDQLDRSGEVRQLAERWRSIFLDEQLSGAWTVVANVNDPLVAYASAPARHLVACAVPTAWLGDAASCPICTRSLVVEPNSSGDNAAGSWNCECGFDRPQPLATLTETLRIGETNVALDVALPGEFNRANAALALVVAQGWGTDLVAAASRIAEVTEVAGRFSVRSWSGRRWRLMLAKNPAGLAALLPALASTNHDLVIAINANVADGHDPAWLYDAPFELLEGRRVWCDGQRALDLGVRLDYGGIEARLVRDDPSYPLSVGGTEPIDVIANYTAFAEWMTRTSPC